MALFFYIYYWITSADFTGPTRIKNYGFGYANRLGWNKSKKYTLNIPVSIN